ncbi:MAG: hypothetical protein HY700_17935 [Gemmatimonadetes bacterium]|nr:hypothetical protein [Gemmatimonadota bacterium]
MFWTVAPRFREDPVDQNLVAVAPFEVLDPSLGLWREGLVDLLSRTLDGAGPLRTVSPSTVLRSWTGRADPESAEKLGRKTGAGLVVFGQMGPSGQDSVWIALRLLDRRDKRILPDIEIRQPLSRIDRLQAALTAPLLREIGANRTLAVTRLASFGSTSVPAIKSFLQGEQFFRRTYYDSATLSYQRALQADSNFALPFHRLYWTRISQGGGDSIAWSYAAKAGALNRGLSARESLLVTIEALSALQHFASSITDSTFWKRTTRLFETIENAIHGYPDDPEFWLQLAFARHENGYLMGFPSVQTLAAVDRAIELDSSLTPAYLYAILPSIRLGDESLAVRYGRAYLARDPVGPKAEVIKLFLQLEREETTDVSALVQGISNAVLFSALDIFRWSTGVRELDISLARALLARQSSMSVRDSSLADFYMALALAWRGYGREAARQLGSRSPSNLFNALVYLGSIPPATARSVYEPLLRSTLWPATHLSGAMTWWAEQRDTVSLIEARRRTDSAAKVARDPSERLYLKRMARVSRGYLHVVRGDTAAAVPDILSFPDSACPGRCFLDRYFAANLLLSTGRYEEARRIVSADLFPPAAENNPMIVMWHLQRARVAEHLGDRFAAIRDYAFVAAVWKNADANLQKWVDESQRALARLRP